MGLAIYKFKHLLTTFDNNPLIGLYRIWGQFPLGLVSITMIILGLATSQMKTGRKTLDFLSKPLLVLAKSFANSLRSNSAKTLELKHHKVCRKSELAPTVFTARCKPNINSNRYLKPRM